jgi:phosphoglycerate kinase
MAYTFLKANGVDIGRSLVEQDKIPVAKELMANANTNGVKMLLPTDHMTGDEHERILPGVMLTLQKDAWG